MHVAVVGHITKDLIRIPGKPDRAQAGGSAFYVSVALRSLGLDVTVVTAVAADDEAPLLGGLAARGIRVLNGRTEVTTTFENVYEDHSLTARQQWVRSVAAPITVRDVLAVRADAFHVGPLTRREIPLEVLEELRKHTQTVAFDAQGMLREVVDERVQPGRWTEVSRALPLIDVLKVDDVEAARLVGSTTPLEAAARLASFGVRDVLVTFADRGSLVSSAGHVAHIPALRPAAYVDATGCGDTYAAGYLYARLGGAEPEGAACFAAAAASLKLEGYGPFSGTAEDVRAHLARADRVSHET